MKRSSAVRRVVAGVTLGTAILVFAGPVTPAKSAQAPGGTLEILRERAQLMSGLQTLDLLGALPAGLEPAARTASATAGSDPLAWLALKRSLSKFARRGGSGPAFGAVNVGIGVDSGRDENEPTVAANPRDADVLVAGSHSFDPTTQINHCVAYSSLDGGSTWSAPVEMLQLTPESFCSDPVLAFAPDGRRVYYAYMDIRVLRR